jgi:hypothetical protein
MDIGKKNGAVAGGGDARSVMDKNSTGTKWQRCAIARRRSGLCMGAVAWP